MIVGVPDIAVVERVDVRVPITIIAIDIANRDALCRAPSMTPTTATTLRILSGLNLIRGIEPTSARHQLVFLFSGVSYPEPRHFKRMPKMPACSYKSIPHSRQARMGYGHISKYRDQGSEFQSVLQVADKEMTAGAPDIAVVERVDARVPNTIIAIDTANRDASISVLHEEEVGPAVSAHVGLLAALGALDHILGLRQGHGVAVLLEECGEHLNGRIGRDAEDERRGLDECPASRGFERRDDTCRDRRLLGRKPVVEIDIAIVVTRANEALRRLFPIDRPELGPGDDREQRRNRLLRSLFAPAILHRLREEADCRFGILNRPLAILGRHCAKVVLVPCEGTGEFGVLSFAHNFSLKERFHSAVQAYPSIGVRHSRKWPG